MKNCSFQTGLKDGDKLYMVERELGLLMEYDLDTLSYQILTKLEYNKMLGGVWAVNNIIKVEDVLFLAFRNHDFLMSYDINTGNTEIHGEDFVGQNGIEKSLLFKNELWMFPVFTSQKIKVFDVISKQFQTKECLQGYLQTKKYINGEKRIWFITAIKGILYFALLNTPYIITYAVDDEDIQVYETEKNDRISKVVHDGEQFWISFVDNCKIARWDIDKGIQEIIEIKEIKIDDRENPILGVYKRKSILFVIPTFVPCVYSYKRNGQELSMEHTKDFNRSNPDKKSASFRTFIFRENQLLMFPFEADRIIVADLETGELKERECTLTKQEGISCGITKEMLREGIVEKDWFSLEDFLKFEM